MAKIEIQVDDNILSEASRILHSLGMDVEMAVNILLRRTIIEKGLPMTMTTPVWSHGIKSQEYLAAASLRLLLKWLMRFGRLFEIY